MERLFRGRIIDGEFRADDPATRRELLLEWPHPVIYESLQDEERIRTRQQEKFWHGVVVPIVEQCWMHEKGWAAPPAKGVVHGALVRAVFGEIETPLGPERRSSTTLTIKEYGTLIEWAGDYLLRKYKVLIPLPNEAEVAL